MDGFEQDEGVDAGQKREQQSAQSEENEKHGEVKQPKIIDFKTVKSFSASFNLFPVVVAGFEPSA